MRYLLAFVLTLFSLSPEPSALQSSSDVHGTWTAEIHAGKVFLQVRTSPPPDWTRGNEWRGDWSMGQSFPVDELSGLPGNDERLTAAALRFDLRREAGTLSFDGAFRDGRGAGLFTFAARSAYLAEMKSLGFKDDIPVWRQFQLAVHDVGPKYVRELKTEGYSALSLDQIQRGKNHGVGIDYIRDLKAQGFRDVPWDELVRTRDHGVTGDYIKALKAEGLTNATLDEFVRTRDHGVTQKYLQEMRAAGFSGATVDELVRARDHGVTPEFVKNLEAQGYRSVPLADVVRARDHGVSPEFIEDLKQVGVKDLTLAEAVRLRDHGVTPGFVNHARARGYTTTDPEELVRLKNRGLWRD